MLGKASANIAGLCALTTGGGQAEVHILVQDPSPAFEALQASGIKIATDLEVIVLDVEDRPGALGEVALKLGIANVNRPLPTWRPTSALSSGQTTSPTRRPRSADRR